MIHTGKYMEMRKAEDRTITKHPFWPLITEIDKLKQTLCKPDVDDSTLSMMIEEHAKQIQDAIPPNPGDISCVEISPTSYVPSSHTARVPDTYCPYPLCRLLNQDKFCPAEIPLSILELLVTAGFDVNGTAKVNGQTCLYSAIDSGHYNAVRWLVQHGADCNAIYYKLTPIVYLASRPDMPLDLFQLLKTPENLNDGTDKCLPLHEACSYRCINSALHLISLGAEVDKIDGLYECLPIECYTGEPWANGYEHHVKK